MKRLKARQCALALCVLLLCSGCGAQGEESYLPLKDGSGAVSAGSSVSSEEDGSQEESGEPEESSEPGEPSEEPPASSESRSSGVEAPASSLDESSYVTIDPSDAPTSSEPERTGTRDATPYVRSPSASGDVVLGNDTVQIDASNTSEGYVMVRYLGSNNKVKLQVTANGGGTYTYNLSTSGNYETFPLTSGSGGYTLNVFENVSGDQYAQVCGEYVEASLNSSLLPFLYPNQYCNFWSGSSTVELGSQLAQGASSDLEVVESVYNWVIKNISYDFAKADPPPPSGYLPNVDSIIASGKGICFDYAAVMATMLRTQRIPTKLVVGYAGNIYHAWVSVYISDVGWVNGIIYFDGTSWVRMDPTFASSGNQSSDIMQYIGNGSNYNALYVY